jgi:hypothetical protein
MPKFQGRDIRTISAVLSNEALARHIKVCELAIEAPGRMPATTHNQAAGTRS